MSLGIKAEALEFSDLSFSVNRAQSGICVTTSAHSFGEPREPWTLPQFVCNTVFPLAISFLLDFQGYSREFAHVLNKYLINV